MRVLGLNVHRGASSAALLVDGKSLFTAREERFSRKLSDSSFPRRAAMDCLRRAKLEATDLDQVVCAGKPLRQFERVLATQMAAFPLGAKSFTASLSSWLGEKLWIRNLVSKELELPSPDRVGFVSHLRCHAAAALYSSPYDEAAILVADKAREWESTLLARGVGSVIEPLATMRHPHSLVAAEEAFARALGFEGEAAVERMRGSAHEGQASNLLLAYLPSHQPSSFSVDAELLSPDFRLCAEECSARERNDLAASAQHALETRFLELLRALHERVPVNRLCFTGRLAENRSLVAAALEKGPFREIFIPEDPADSGTALGAALHAASPSRVVQSFGRFQLETSRDPLAPRQFTDAQLRSMIRDLEQGRLIAWHRTRDTVPCRAESLVLGRPLGPDAANRLRSSLQRNDAGLPTRLVLPAERLDDYCVPHSTTPLALLAGARVDVQSTPQLRALAPSAVLKNGTVWPRIVARTGGDPDLHALLHALEDHSLPPVLLETSLRLRGAPVAHRACDAEEAVRRSQIHRLYRPGEEEFPAETPTALRRSASAALAR